MASCLDELSAEMTVVKRKLADMTFVEAVPLVETSRERIKTIELPR